MRMKPSLAVFLHSDRYDRLYQAASLLLTASSMGWTCHLFLFFGALASYMAGTWDDVHVGGDSASGGAPAPWAAEIQRGFDSGNFPSLYSMIEKARAESGGLSVLACSTSCKVLDLDIEDVRTRVDEIVGLHTMVRIAGETTHVLYI
jgi:peroxiredoxin family protein